METKFNQNERIAIFYNVFLGENGKEYAINNPDKASVNVERFFDAMAESTSEKEMYILIKRFGINCEPLTLTELGFEFKVTSERIRQIQSKVIRKLKHPGRSRIGYAILLGIEPEPYNTDELIIPEDLSTIKIEDLNLSVRTTNVIKRANINTLEDLVNLSNEDICNIPIIGKKGIIEILEFLNKYDLKLRG